MYDSNSFLHSVILNLLWCMKKETQNKQAAYGNMLEMCTALSDSLNRSGCGDESVIHNSAAFIVCDTFHFIFMDIFLTSQVLDLCCVCGAHPHIVKGAYFVLYSSSSCCCQSANQERERGWGRGPQLRV